MVLRYGQCVCFFGHFFDEFNVLFLFWEQIFALVTFVMCIMHEKYLVSSSNQRQTKRNKKKSTSDVTTQSNIYAPNEKERIHIITSLINRLKTEINTIDAAIGKFLLWK